MGREGIGVELETIKQFLFWCMIINFAVYTLTALALLFMRNFVHRVNAWVFGISEEDSARSMESYMTTYKLLVTIFNFAPWLALVIMGR